MSNASGHRPRLAIMPGSFDPLTNGHVDIIERGTRLFDRVIVAVLVNESKAPLFAAAERVQMIRDVFKGSAGIEVDTFGGLLVDYARERGAAVILKGLRDVSDFGYETQMALMNRRLQGDIDTMFMMPAEAYSYTSSRLIKEVCRLGGDVHGLVPPLVEERLRRRLESLRHPDATPRNV